MVSGKDTLDGRDNNLPKRGLKLLQSCILFLRRNLLFSIPESKCLHLSLHPPPLSSLLPWEETHIWQLCYINIIALMFLMLYTRLHIHVFLLFIGLLHGELGMSTCTIMLVCEKIKCYSLIKMFNNFGRILWKGGRHLIHLATSQILQFLA
jgi:hypothetical protein